MEKMDSQDKICYCFDFSRGEIRSDYQLNGKSTIFEEIKGRCKKGEANCKINNPKGSCCLGDVKKAAETVLSEAVLVSTGRKGSLLGWGGPFLMGIGTLGAYLLTSACCWAPPLLLSLGLSSGALSLYVAQYRPFLYLTSGIFFLGFLALLARKFGFFSQKSSCCERTSNELGLLDENSSGKDPHCEIPASGSRP